MTDHDEDFAGIQRVRQTTAAEAFAALVEKNQRARDRAVGAVLLLAHDGVISQSRAAELLGMSIMQIRDEFRKVAALSAARPATPKDSGKEGEG